MSKNLNCAAMGYDCVFSVTEDDDKQNLILDAVEEHAGQKHLELLGVDSQLKPEIKAKLLDLLNQSQYHKQEPKP